MADDGDTLAEIIAGWEHYQTHLINAVTPLTVEQLSLCAAPQLRTIGQLAGHIIGARARWFRNFLGEGGSSLAPLTRYGGIDQTAMTAADLVAGLQLTWSVMKDALDLWSADDLAMTFTREYRGETSTLSRRWVVWHLLEHDLHHGGELMLTLGLHGLPTPDI